ncbi:MAG: prepilin-type N-terminal cleavage/methylation domain-containing protein [Patescibacteria group bacterium]
MVKLFSKQSGVTVVELVVVIAIVGLVSSVILFNYSDFSTNVSIRNLSQEVALSIRKSQTFATSVQSLSSGGAPSYPSFGMVFSMESATFAFLPTPKRFISFADIPPSVGVSPNKKYDSGGSICGSVGIGEECIEAISITSADTLIGIDTDATGPVTTGTVSITFRRPSPDAIICYIPAGQSDCIAQIPSYVKLTFQSAKGLKRLVSVWNTGQINVE